MCFSSLPCALAPCTSNLTLPDSLLSPLPYDSLYSQGLHPPSFPTSFHRLPSVPSELAYACQGLISLMRYDRYAHVQEGRNTSHSLHSHHSLYASPNFHSSSLSISAPLCALEQPASLLPTPKLSSVTTIKHTSSCPSTQQTSVDSSDPDKFM